MTDAPRESPSPRLVLGAAGSPVTLLDGGWWPQTSDPAAELPGLVLAIDHLHGPVRRLALSAGGWAEHPRGLRIGDRTVRLGFFASQSTTLLTAMCGDGGRVDLLVVPPDTDEKAAETAMAEAATATTREAVRQLTAVDSEPDPRAVPMGASAGRQPAAR